MNDTQRTQIEALLDCLLPGQPPDWPGAAALDLTDAFIAEWRDAVPLATLLGKLPAEFTRLTGPERAAACAQIEATDDALFGRTVTAAYRVYYSNEAIRDRISLLGAPQS